MSDGIRQRKNANKSPKKSKSGSTSSDGSSPAKTPQGSSLDDAKFVGTLAYFLIGSAVCVYVGKWFTNYMHTLHENHLWFENIKEVEREISLRTECGLYYSYYKELVHSPSFKEGLYDLTVDNRTEHGRSINILQRFNVYQEVVLAGLWRGIFSHMEPQPILFYVYVCFLLTGVGVSVLFALSWYMTGTFAAGILTAVFYTVNLDDSTRVFFTVNLREIFAFPFLWAQIMSVCVYFNRNNSRTKDIGCQCGIFIFGFLFAITWQFNQFVFLLQVLSIIAVGVLGLVPIQRARTAMVLVAASLLAVWMSQYFQAMVLGSLVLSLIPAGILVMSMFRGKSRAGCGLIVGICYVIIQLFLIAILTIILNFAVKTALNLEADAHIFKFVKGKFGLENPRDFDSKVYLCHGAFTFLDNGFWLRTSKTFMLPPYLMFMGGVIFVLGRDLLMEWSETNQQKLRSKNPDEPSDKDYFFNKRPDLAFLAIESVVSGIMGIMALRMKYLWTPHICIIGAMLFSDFDLWRNILGFFRVNSKAVVSSVRNILPLLLAALLAFQYYPTYKSQMEDLKEFWDPDTVELMNWINNSTKPDASFGGSMQLLAGVKLSTGRHLTNHPHFEDKWLRQRTKKIYQIYARKEPREVYDILMGEGTDYIILEDSICKAPSDGCRTPDLMDLENGHIPDGGANGIKGLTKSSVKRFCDEIRHETTAFTRLFTLVMKNPTFRVYKLIK